MTTLDAPRSVVLDESAHQFIATFMTNVATVSGYGTNRIVTIARIKTLLLAAIGTGEVAPSTAWSMLHHAVADLIAAPDAPHETHGARDYLGTFLEENGDLARA